MKTLTLLPHYAAFIAGNVKHIETRPKSVGTKFRGDLIIHAGAKWNTSIRREWLKMITKFPDLHALFPANRYGYVTEPRQGAAICIVTVVDIVPATDVFDTLTPLEIAVGDYSYTPDNPRYAWKLENVRPFEYPIPAKGQLGLWNWKGELPQC